MSGIEASESGWVESLVELRTAGRVTFDLEAGGRWFATEASRDPVTVLRGRLEALGPVVVGGAGDGETPELARVAPEESQALLELEARGAVLRCRIAGREAWCERRLLARIHRYTLERLRREIEPASSAELWRFLGCWQHADPAFRLEGPRGVHEVAKKLAGFEIPAADWEPHVLRTRLHDFRPEWLDQLTLTGELVWGRLWGAGNSAIRRTPVCLLPREDLAHWLALARIETAERPPLSTYARTLLETLEARGACFTQELEAAARLLPEHFEMGLTQLIGHGLVTSDSFGGLRRLITPPSRRKGVMRRAPLMPAGRWSAFRARETPEIAEPRVLDEDTVEFAARRLLARYGVVFRRLLERERIPVAWRDLVRVYRRLELRGELRGGRFVHLFAGEQYALPEAVELMRRLRRLGESPRRHALDRLANHERPRATQPGLEVAATDPLNLQGVLTPDARIPAQGRRKVQVA